MEKGEGKSFAWEVWFVDSSDVSVLFVFKIQGDSVFPVNLVVYSVA